MTEIARGAASYFRYRSARPNSEGIHVGVFGLVNVLGRHGMLTPEEEDFRRRTNAWYDAAYPNPTTAGSDAYARRDAVSWFKREAPRHLLEPLPRYLAILDAHRVEWERVESDDPGDVLYEDAVQVVAAPRTAREPGAHPARAVSGGPR